MRLADGVEFAGYTVVSRLGRGGMATVYLAREPGIERAVALKVMPEDLVDDAHFGARFEQEARIIASLDHPGIVPLYRFGVHDGVPWMALRYVDGGDLGARLAVARSAAEVLPILRATAAALDHAHRHGVVHRDLKPQNVLVSRDGAAYLADFGVAKLLEGSTRLRTITGGFVGTPAYMAPEQALGEAVGPRTDVYALAVICFQWLTGQLPYDADTPAAVLLKHVESPLPAHALARLSNPVAEVLRRGLAKAPRKRPATAGAFVAELERALAAEPVRRERGGARRLFRRPERATLRGAEQNLAALGRSRGRRRLAWLLGGVLVALGGAGFWLADPTAPAVVPARASAR
jgi:serine/threonine protein kinase